MLDERYDARLVLAGDAATVAGVDADAISISVPARLRDDPRPTAQFVFAGRLADDRLTATDTTRDAFAAYLTGLRRQQTPAAAEAVRQTLAVPDGVELRLPEPLPDGESYPLTLAYAGQPLAAVPTSWSSDSLTYEPDLAGVSAAISSALVRLVEAGPLRQALVDDWRSLAAQLAPPAGSLGAAFFSRCVLLDMKPTATAEPFELAAVAVVGPPDAVPEERIELSLALAFEAGALAWQAAAIPAAQRQVAQALQGLAADPQLRTRRQQRAVETLARELNVAAGAIQAQPDGDLLLGTASSAGGVSRYEWTWNPAELEYADRRLLPPPSLERDLAALAAGPVDAASFVSVLREVTRRKTSAYGHAAYRPAPELEAQGDPTAALLETSRALQRLVAPNVAADPFATIFVEYYVGPDDVYGLAWNVQTGPGDQIVGCEQPRVWRVMATAELRGFATPGAFRERYTADAALGENLLGRALGPAGPPLAASAGGSFGLVIAPHDRLWLVRWEQVRVAPRSIEGLDDRGAGAVREFASLRQVLQPSTSRRGQVSWRRAGVWCAPALGGVAQVPAEEVRLALGALLPGRPEVVLNFDRHNDVVFAYAEDLSLSGDFAWREYVERVQRREIGYTFWERGWAGERWRPTPYTSFALIRSRAE
jgi:hypothetical protein